MVVLVVLGWAVPASAGHYLIADVPDVIAKEHHAALRAAGLSDTKQLYERIVARKGRRALAVRTAIPYKQLTSWARQLDLMQINGIGPKMVRLLNAAGVPNLRTFRKAGADALHAAMKAANRGAKYSEVVPSAGVLRGWIRLAASIKPRLE